MEIDANKHIKSMHKCTKDAVAIVFGDGIAFIKLIHKDIVFNAYKVRVFAVSKTAKTPT